MPSTQKTEHLSVSDFLKEKASTKLNKGFKKTFSPTTFEEISFYIPDYNDGLISQKVGENASVLGFYEITYWDSKEQKEKEGLFRVTDAWVSQLDASDIDKTTWFSYRIVEMSFTPIYEFKQAE